jgi:hypothetical protein
MCLCMYVFMYVCLYSLERAWWCPWRYSWRAPDVCMYAYVHVPMTVLPMCVCMLKCVSDVCICKSVYMACMCVCVCALVAKLWLYVNVYVRAGMHTTHVYGVCAGGFMYVCVHDVCVCISMYICIYMYMYMYIYIYIYIYTHTHTNKQTHTHIRTCSSRCADLVASKAILRGTSIWAYKLCMLFKESLDAVDQSQ